MKQPVKRSFGGTARPTRVAEQVQHELGQILVRGLKDPRIVGFVTITGVKMSPDLREGIVYYSVFGTEAERKSTQAGLEAAASFLKREVGHNLRLRLAPNLRFVFDESIEQGDRIEKLIREVHDHDAEAPAEASKADKGEDP
jgi:ribosome-binding factor A